MKKIFLIFAAFLLGCSCSNTGDIETKTPITVISREDGSGTRKAFSDLFELEQTDQSGAVTDITTDSSAVTNSAAVMMASVLGNPGAIGYLSLGTPCDLVKKISINGVEPNKENIKTGSYSFCRPFIAVTFGEQSDAVKDFLDFVCSEQGSFMIEQNDFISVSTNEYISALPEGSISVTGSSSAMSLMQKFKEAYSEINPNVKVTIQQSDSSSGIAAVTDKVCDIGLVSRQLTKSEREKGIKQTTIALDGIAVILNRKNLIEDLTSEQIKGIYSGKINFWEELSGKSI